MKLEYSEDKAVDMTNLINTADHVELYWEDDYQAISGCQLFYTRKQLADLFETTIDKVNELILSNGQTRFKTLEEAEAPKTSELIELSKKYLHSDIALVDIYDDTVEYKFYLED